MPEPDDVERVLPVWLTPDEWEELLERAGGLEGSPAQPQKTSDAQPIEAPMMEAPKTCLPMQSSARSRVPGLRPRPVWSNSFADASRRAGALTHSRGGHQKQAGPKEA